MPEESSDVVDRFYMELGRRIRSARDGAGITQADLAAKVGMTRSSIANLEAGRQRMPLHLFAAIAVTLGEDPNMLLPFELLSADKSLFRNLDRHLDDATSQMRDFVEGTVAGLDLET